MSFDPSKSPTINAVLILCVQLLCCFVELITRQKSLWVKCTWNVIWNIFNLLVGEFEDKEPKDTEIRLYCTNWGATKTVKICYIYIENRSNYVLGLPLKWVETYLGHFTLLCVYWKDGAALKHGLVIAWVLALAGNLHRMLSEVIQRKSIGSQVPCCCLKTWVRVISAILTTGTHIFTLIVDGTLVKYEVLCSVPSAQRLVNEQSRLASNFKQEGRC